MKIMGIKDILISNRCWVTALAISAGMMAWQPCGAVSQIVIEPLFEYPTAPEEMTDLQMRSDYLMEHFWDAMDFKRREPVDQNALNDAFSVYATAMPYSSMKSVNASIDRLVKSLKGNPLLLLQFTKAAEESLYGPRAGLWSDDAYLPFLKALVAYKSLPDSRKQRYAMQLDLLKRNAIGAKFPAMRLTLRNARHADFKPDTELTIVEFGNPDCDDCRFAKTKLDVATDLAEKIDEGKLKIMFVVADAVPDDQNEILQQFASMPESWVPGICYGGDDIYDIRMTPSFYILDRNGKILAKNLDVARAVEYARNYFEPSR